MSVTLVTGGYGLVGRGLWEALKSEKIDDEQFVFLSSREGDLTDYSSCKRLFIKHKPTKVIHLAANVGGLYKNMNQGMEMFVKNMKMNENILNCCLEFSVEKCVSCLSTCIFPDAITYPITEDMLHNGLPHFSNFGYAMAKRHIDVINRVYNSSQSMTRFTSIIPCNVYGPFDNFNIADGHVLPSLIHKAYLAKNKNQPFVVLGSGKPLRQFIYNIDLGRLILNVHKSYNCTEPIILAPDEEDEVLIKEVAQIIANCFNISTELRFDETCSDGQYKKTASNKKLRSLWPDFKFTDISEGISSTSRWLEANYESARK